MSVGFGYCCLSFLVSEKSVQAGAQQVQMDACVAAIPTTQTTTTQTSTSLGMKYYAFKLVVSVLQYAYLYTTM
jgi:hypothetical protein